MSTNTRVTYASTQNAYLDQADDTVLAGELSDAQVQRLTLSIFFNRLDAMIDACGLRSLPNNGTGIRLQAVTPTLEAPTNPRVDAATFFEMARREFARQAIAAETPRSEAIDRLIKTCSAKPANAPLSDKRGFLGVESERQAVGGWLQAVLMGPMAAGAILSDLHYPIHTYESVDPHTFGDPGNYEALASIDAAWPTVMGADSDGEVVKKALMSTEPLTAGEAVRALTAAKRYIAAAADFVAGIR